jgi:hypothetical protein
MISLFDKNVPIIGGSEHSETESGLGYAELVRVKHYKVLHVGWQASSLATNIRLDLTCSIAHKIAAQYCLNVVPLFV